MRKEKKILKCNQKIFGFTLAEVLITLGIIGIVAALTIPTLVTNIQDKLNEHKKQVIETRLIEGLNMLNIKENGLSAKYNSTEDFVKALSKHMKLVQICGKNNLQKCFPYENINYDRINGSKKQVKVSSLSNPASLKLNGEEWLDLAGFITAGGIPFIVSFNSNCSNQLNNNGSTVIDPDRPIKDIPYQCIDGIYDLNGAKSPNKMSSDIVTLHSASVYRCIKELGNFCVITKSFSPEKLLSSDCENKYKESLADNCCTTCDIYGGDSWLGAKVACQNAGGRLPNEEELTQLVSMFYKNESGNHPELTNSWENTMDDTTHRFQYPMDNSLLSTIGISPGFLWSSVESDNSNDSARIRTFYAHQSSSVGIGRLRDDGQALCIGD